MNKILSFKSLGEQIAVARKAHAWSQTELAAQAGLSRATISQLERGVTDLGVRKMMRLLGVLGLGISLQVEGGRPTLEDLTAENIHA